MRSLIKRRADLVTNTLLRELKADSSVRDDAAPYNAQTIVKIQFNPQEVAAAVFGRHLEKKHISGGPTLVNF